MFFSFDYHGGKISTINLHKVGTQEVGDCLPEGVNLRFGDKDTDAIVYLDKTQAERLVVQLAAVVGTESLVAATQSGDFSKHMAVELYKQLDGILDEHDFMAAEVD